MITFLIVVYIMSALFCASFMFHHSDTILVDSFSAAMMTCITFAPLVNTFFMVVAFVDWMAER